MSLKIIGVQPLIDCSDSIIKNLSVNLFYPLDNNYVFSIKTEKISRKQFQKVPDNFFFSGKKKSSLQDVNIQAIVGKNGKGKSSIVELIIRILNNFYKQYRIGKVTDSLLFVEDLHANLFFEVNGRLGKIYVDSRKLKKNLGDNGIIAKFFIEENLIFDSVQNNNPELYREEIIDLEDLFFTMYVNYSLYGLDDRDYIKECGYVANDDENQISWLTQLFHKNDGYQTPIVLHPFREGGQVHIRNEKYLVSQRLLSLILDALKSEFHLTEDLIVDKIKLTFKKQDALEKYLDQLINSRNLETSSYNEVESILISSPSKVSKQETVESINQYYIFLHQNRILLDKFKEIITKKKIRRFSVTDRSTYSDLTHINIASFSRLLGIVISKDSDYKSIYLQLMKDVDDEELKYKIKYILTEIGDFNFYIYNLFQTLTIYFVFWKKHFKLLDNNNIFRYKRYHLERNLFYYCLVKSHKSIGYPKYDAYNRGSTIIYFAAKLCLDKKNTINPHSEFLEKLVSTDDSHISLKLRQAQKLLHLCLHQSNSELVKFYKKFLDKSDYADITDFNNAINQALRSEKNTSRLTYLPPQVFETEIFLKSVTATDKDININTLSSGEYQKNSIISSLVYHLKNIDSVQYEKKIKMKSIGAIEIAPTYSFNNINVFLDEIELYFHPEYQRVFISDLLKQLSDISFRNIKNINFLFITHSPFILSDLPQQNILFLNDNAKPEIFSESYNTFGGNIHDLLSHNFFLKNGVIGEFALDKINNIIKQLNSNKIKLMEEKEKDTLLKNIFLIGENFLRNKLLDMYYTKFDKQKRIEELEAELLKLKEND
ncbi:ATP-binding cassette domain-containing protein [Chryseobacterium indoltheticum]|uniref:ATPase AAA-type core domain-containing protein n=1 Tax=Chryseobacterium indoltheticum TaxID=254 RepID=A0A3G6N199_9FLAO|nr:hypothetical protein [Chryseobacterium indoltheticum]AZA60208.1 hypothetical protein EG340_03765 [Chryseobacterium indoltheticum]